MLKAIKYVIHIIREEAKRRGWVSALKFILVLLGYIGLSVIALHPLLKWLFPSSVIAAWVVIVSLAVVVPLLVVINFMRTYHERITSEVLGEWSKMGKILEKLYELRLQGLQLENRCRSNEPLSSDEIGRWHRHAAAVLERNLGIEYRRRFYEHSETGEVAPEKPSNCEFWINTRLAKINEVIAELEQPPQQLVSHKGANMIQSDAIKYLVK
jgi:hypothetical protein